MVSRFQGIFGDWAGGFVLCVLSLLLLLVDGF